MIRFSALLSDGTQFSLYGSDYYNDKSVFWNHHVSNAYSFLLAVSNTGFPITVTDKQDSTSIVINSFQNLRKWIKDNQSVDQAIYFSEAKDLEDIQKEFPSIIDLVKRFLVKQSDRSLFNVWHVYASFDTFSKQIRMAQTNLERKCQEFGSRELIQAMQDCFESVLSVKDETSGLDILAYSRQEHDKINGTILMTLCKKALAILDEKLEIVNSKKFYES